MKFEMLKNTPSKEEGNGPDDKNKITRRDFLKYAAIVAGSVGVGIASGKTAEYLAEKGYIDDGKREIFIAKGSVIGKEIIPGGIDPAITISRTSVGGLSQGLSAGAASYKPDSYILKIKIDGGEEIRSIYVSKDQYEKHNIDDKLSVRHELDRSGKIRSSRLDENIN